MAIIGKLVKKFGVKKFAKKIGARKSMTFAQKAALKKAVKASALARRALKHNKGVVRRFAKITAKNTKSISRIKVTKKALRSARQNRKLVELVKTGQRLDSTNKLLKDFTAGTSRIATQAAKTQKDLVTSAGMSRQAQRIVRRASRPAFPTVMGTNVPKSIAWSIALTAAVNPTRTMETYKEAKRALAQSIVNRDAARRRKS